MLAPTTQMLEDARNAGANDDYIAQEIIESALLYFDGIELPEDITDDERDLIQDRIITAYAEGVASCY